ncbi:TIGR03943 family protein [Streptomonospora sp. S1-112]|uniref:TIGR03943 family protein n=1 Tax=Streptomonospora mangrovi TaxID=2883123 RepID=A0A9X3NQC2_9ACTN|nr:TIGR03943 family protein [Streptomonospora mangrovi]MDA0567205.1 TIGR03943 family protein [Streptomonospora mangrovi]
MNRVAQGIVVVLLGAAALTSTLFTDLYLNYVQPGFRPFLIAAGAALVALGVLIVAGELRAVLRGEEPAPEPHGGHGGDHGHGHGGHAHDRAPRVAWLLLLPVVAVFVVAPPALGAYTAESAGTAAPPREGDSDQRFDGLGEPDASGAVEMELQDFVSRAWTDESRAMEGRTIRLTGFAVPHPDGEDEGWYLARLQMACCAADAIVNRVLITDQPAPPTDSWWEVKGTWQAPEGDLQSVRDHRFSVEEMTEVTNPPDPYE